jgi:hypothetical protein
MILKNTLGAGLISLALALGLTGPAAAQQSGAPRVITTGAGESVSITAYKDGLRRDKYVVTHKDSRQVWYAQDGSENAGPGETGWKTNRNQWCRVRYLYGDPVRGGTSECWGAYMYSSHLITALDGTHLELWFSPDSLTYFKIRNQETGIWYAHDGSANDGRLRTTKDDWCRQIYYHMSGIIKLPNECKAFAAYAVNAIGGLAGAAAQKAELAYVRNMLGEKESKSEEGGKKVGFGAIGVAGEEGLALIAKGSISQLDWDRGAGALKKLGSGGAKGALASAGIGLGVGVAVDYGVDAIKDKAGWKAKDANAGWIAAEVVTTTVATTSISTAIMVAGGASFNPVVMGVGVLVGGAVAAGEEIAKASADTGIRFEAGGMAHPRYNRDLNGITERVFAQKNPPGTFEWVNCAAENGRCEFSGLRSVMYGAGDKWVEVAAIDGLACNSATFGRDPTPGVAKTCQVQQLNWDRQSRYFVKQGDNQAIYYQMGPDRHCLMSNMGVMNAYGGTGTVRVVSRLAMKGTNDGACALPNGYYKVGGGAQIWYLSGPGTSRDGPTGQDVGTRMCLIPDLATLNGMSGGAFNDMPAGTDLFRHRTNNGSCANGRWASTGATKLNDIGDGWAITQKVVLGSDLEIVKLSDDLKTWVTQPGAAFRIGGSKVEPWVMTKAGAIYQWNGGNWTLIGGKLANDVGQGWIVSKEPTNGGFLIYRWDPVKKVWENIPGGATRIGGTYDSPWVVNSTGQVFQYVVDKWEFRDTNNALDVGDGWIAAAANNQFVNRTIFRWNPDSKQWNAAEGGPGIWNIGGTVDHPTLSSWTGEGFFWR